MAETQSFTMLYFASAKDATQTDSEKIEWSPSLDSTKLTALLVERHPALKPILAISMYAVNMEYTDDPSWTVQPNDEVAIIPPVSGG
ncbi:hypothetical protein DFQ27_005925 [Actinomortierella ambigua]|uniref:Molybdopterin synthase sulfur carrier subunit n=1 Tax=Actinomortierella ambigua TaxID=1343610 RepID=A0A9P6U287_9FUNG|nr:hypothetical protein DFQ26_007424 [Actinomortierella ambigua]KAG0256065.1 hypothetical protein DFQ27_005925 [Actinomortierella ambigua]